MRRLLDRMLPVRFDNLDRIVELAFETFFIAFIGTTLAVAVSIPLAFMAASNTTLNRHHVRPRPGRSSWRCGPSPT
jgi:phosphonate transport system permease protein